MNERAILLKAAEILASDGLLTLKEKMRLIQLIQREGDR